MMRQMLGTAVIALVLAACAGTQGMGAAGGAQPLANTSWVLTRMNGAAPAAGVTAPTLEFATDRVSGNGGCNLFNGPFTQSGGTVDMGPLVSTRRACADPAGNAQETAYLRALDEATAAAVVDGMLELTTPAGTLRFRPATG
ncbi:META domain-containing protein [Longimicrobium sp.]|uniref:META domain-containing protein n=1 Tax=Longimicrobium sp. TaxID=2029185 RepID=UPI002E347DE7|nr:META domain-containing protein [Longimicrobium sp.]HEX6040881.1 META domain-containing protein [Longimicrobium sp.]